MFASISCQSILTTSEYLHNMLQNVQQKGRIVRFYIPIVRFMTVAMTNSDLSNKYYDTLVSLRLTISFLQIKFSR